MLRRGSLPMLLACVLAVAVPPDAHSARSVPQGWLGVTADGPLIEPGAALDREWDLMATSGVETVRAAFYWSEFQPQGPGATDFSRGDVLVADASARGMAVLPVVHRTPGWAAQRPGDIASPPRDPADYARFVAALVGRYGPRGSFWRERPDLRPMPIRAWQLWNEPNLGRYWSTQPFAPGYVALLRAARRAMRAADPGARAVLAGLPNESWTALRAVYRAGGRGHFDAVALHPYTGRPANVVRLVELARREMRRAGDRRRPVWITELSWPAALGKVQGTAGFETTELGQARRLRDALRRLAAARRTLRIERVVWYTWLSRDGDGALSSFDWSGLRRLRPGGIWSAPSLAAFRSVARRLEGCAKAQGDARRCRSAARGG